MWVALSDLYLDTMMTPGAISHIVRTAREQGFDAWDLRQMLLYEVGPVVFWNCYVVAGVWDMFNEDWLIRKIERNWRRPFHRFRCRLTRRAIFDVGLDGLDLIRRTDEPELQRREMGPDRRCRGPGI